MDKKQKIQDNGPPGRYYHIMLNMADDDLDLYEYRLLGHYRRVCGANNVPCKETVRETAEKIKGMSAAKISTTRRALAEKGWITITPGKGKEIHITLVDRMAENIRRYAACSPHEQPSPDCSPHEQTGKDCSRREQHVHHVNAVFTRRTTCSPREQRSLYIRINNKNQPDQNQPSTTKETSSESPVSGAPAPVVVDDDDRTLILPAIRKLHLTPEAQRELLDRGAAYALAVAWSTQGPGARNPGGLAVSIMRGDGPSEELLDRAKTALELGTVDQKQIDQVINRRQLEELNAQAQATLTQRESSEAPAAAGPPDAGENGLDEKPPNSALNWREVWKTAKTGLLFQIGAGGAALYLRPLQPVRFRDGVLTLRAASLMARDLMEKHYKASIERQLGQFAGTAVRVEFESAQVALHPMELGEHAEVPAGV